MRSPLTFPAAIASDLAPFQPTPSCGYGAREGVSASRRAANRARCRSNRAWTVRTHLPGAVQRLEVTPKGLGVERDRHGRAHAGASSSNAPIPAPSREAQTCADKTRRAERPPRQRTREEALTPPRARARASSVFRVERREGAGREGSGELEGAAPATGGLAAIRAQAGRRSERELSCDFPLQALGEERCSLPRRGSGTENDAHPLQSREHPPPLRPFALTAASGLRSIPKRPVSSEFRFAHTQRRSHVAGGSEQVARNSRWGEEERKKKQSNDGGQTTKRQGKKKRNGRSGAGRGYEGGSPPAPKSIPACGSRSRPRW